MPHDSSLPKQLLHLMEKRQGAGRRKQDRVKASGEASLSSASALPAGAERRKSHRRKPKQTKVRK